MFSIIISEKGGAERREHYGHNEITVGRVKGNDLMLPKGNVSKRHARLIVRDGRYIVTDLKSTNGTYVNHRRITHATLVREGDRIYIGDFVLRLEADAGETSSTDSQFEPDSSGSSTYRRAAHTPGSNPPLDPLLSTRSGAAPAGDQVSHFPLEHDPEEASPMPELPAAPRVPSGLRGRPTTANDHVSGTLEVASSDVSRVGGATVSVAAISSESQISSRAASSHPTATKMWQEHRNAFQQLVQAVESDLDVALLDARIDDAARKAVATAVDASLATMKQADAIPNGIDASTLRTAALAELLDFGALGPHIDSDQLLRARVIGTVLSIQQLGRRDGLDDLGFGSDASVGRVLTRLCRRLKLKASGDQGYLEVLLDNGKRLFAVTPKVTGETHLVVLEGCGERRETLEGLVRSGAVSRGMASLLRHAVRARANVLLVGGPNQGKNYLASALASSMRTGATLWLQDQRHSTLTIPSGDSALPLGTTTSKRIKAIASACRIGPELLVVPPLGGSDTVALLDGISSGAAGVVLHINAATVRKAMDRVAADMAAHRAGLDPHVAKQWLGASFDLAVEVTRLSDGRLRVVRITELRSRGHGTALTDIFSFAYHRVAAGGSVEGAFYASGTVPRIVEDFAARGLPLDVSIFRRPPTF